ncbi:hypothetical protein [Sphingopyxis terrae]|uniref:hypothetical protein n=1 Tax=Sphingopyxis terrae TaxID=33052 RepID=UPI001A9A1A07|nr:hypothetical protein [Sphingopyxis terrae]
MDAAEYNAFFLDPMTDDPAATGGAKRRHRRDRALEAVENAAHAIALDDEAFIIGVAALIAPIHRSSAQL